MNDIALALLTGAVIAIGILGTLIPIVPGIGLIWFAAVAWGVFTGFGPVGVISMIMITGLLAIGVFLGLRIPQRAATGEGLSRVGLFAGIVLAIVFAIALPVVGAPIGFVVGVWLVRMSDTRDAAAAWRSAIRTTIALVKASAAQFVVAVLMSLVWVAWAVIA